MQQTHGMQRVSKTARVLLVRGEPGVGKTTLLKHIFDRIKAVQQQPQPPSSPSQPPAAARQQPSAFSRVGVHGFVTEEVRDKQTNARTGFNIISLWTHQTAPLARTNVHSTHPNV